MCDIVAGTLIISHATADPAGAALVEDIRAGKIEDVSYLGGMRERLHKLELHLDANLPFDYHLVEVPADSEAWKSNYLQFFYKLKLLESLELLTSSKPFAEAMFRSDMQFTVTPNHVLSLASPKGKGTTVKAASFAFDPLHGVYRDMIGMTTPPSTGAGVRIAILDSGIAGDHPVAPVERRNFVDPTSPWKVDDDHGHGTVVALIIQDLVPDAELVVYKVADHTGRVSEWDALAAVAAASASADVVNLSLEFGLGDRQCKTCGRESHSSRSAVFESMIAHASGTAREPLFVAAAGNAGNPALAYPARFGQVAAIGAITSAYALSDESNYGNTDHHAAPHASHFVMPGGNDGPSGTESVGWFAGTSDVWHGTSMAAAYATGVAASLLASAGDGSAVASTVLPIIRQAADTTHFLPHDPDKFGLGVARG